MTTLKEILSTQNPFELFQSWFRTAQETKSIQEPTAMILSTSSQSGQPRSRTVLLKSFSESEGFVFFTNYQSRKGQDLASNPKAALLFYWDPLFRQIKIQGTVRKISRENSVKYWETRPRDSQLAGYMSLQSQPVVGSLDEEFQKVKRQFEGRSIPCPENWGGFSLTPQTMEFWLGHKFRLHDRVEFQKNSTQWTAQQLFP